MEIVQYRNHQLEHGFSTVFVRGLVEYQLNILEGSAVRW